MDFATRIRALIRRNKQFAANATPEDRRLIQRENRRLEAELFGYSAPNGDEKNQQFYSVGRRGDPPHVDNVRPVQIADREGMACTTILAGEKPRAMATVITRVTEALTGEKSGTIDFKSGFVSVNHGNASPLPVQSGALAANHGAGFLTRINVLPVRAMEGESVLVGSAGPLAYVSNCGERRNPQAGVAMKPHRYQCLKVNFDTCISHDDLDAWAHLENYPELVKAAVDQRRNLDRLLIGFHGTHYSSPSDPETYPRRQDCGVGWLEKYRQEARERVVSGFSVAGRNEDGRIVSYGDYCTIDALVLDGWQSAIAQQYREGLVAVCSLNTLYRKEYPFVNAVVPNQPNMERLVNEIMLNNPTLGNLPAVPVPFFPDDAVLVTSLKNLSLYWLEGSARTLVKDEPEYNRLSVYESWNEAYMVERYEAGCLIDGITWRS
ncbi:phage capsid protein [Erwinia psidii]|uniref:P2 family phage major capsid protein n=1 Tax=Erwinia psidii TaxID=69224 RepID=UPI00226B8827|nr:P2 family phage major capsid protein [Erwinia psidii]MCX8967133.1 phage capsid protein [Erwinia psidii]